MKIVFIIFLVVGLGIMAGGGFFYKDAKKFLESSEEAQGVVLRNEYSRSGDSGSYYPIIKYETGSGQEVTFRGNVGSSPASYSPGEKVDVLYKSEKPTNARIKSFMGLWALPTFLSIFGAVFALIGFLPLFFILKRERGEKWAKKYGRSIQAEIVSVYHNTSLKVNNQSPWVVKCQWQDPMSNMVHVFKSSYIWFDPSNYVKKGEMVEVKFDSRNPKRYWVNLETVLPKAA